MGECVFVSDVLNIGSAFSVCPCTLFRCQCLPMDRFIALSFNRIVLLVFVVIRSLLLFSPTRSYTTNVFVLVFKTSFIMYNFSLWVILVFSLCLNCWSSFNEIVTNFRGLPKSLRISALTCGAWLHQVCQGLRFSDSLHYLLTESSALLFFPFPTRRTRQWCVSVISYMIKMTWLGTKFREPGFDPRRFLLPKEEIQF